MASSWESTLPSHFGRPDGADQAEIECISSFKTIITDLKILTPAIFWARTRNRYLQFGWRSAARQHVLEPKKIWRKSKNILIKSEIHKILVMLGRLSWQTEKKCMKPSHLVPRRFELPRHRAINAGRQAVRRISAKIITRTSTYSSTAKRLCIRFDESMITYFVNLSRF